MISDNWRMSFFSDRFAHVKKSGIREIFDLAATLPNYINLGIGEPDFKTPSFIAAAAKKAIDKGLSRYTTNAGLLKLREEIARKLKRENRVIVDPRNQVIVTAGATQAIFVLFHACLNPGDEVILPTPVFTAYRYATLLAGGIPVEVPLSWKDGFGLDPKTIEKAVSKRTKLIVLNSPCNPTGAVFSKRSMIEVCEIAAKNGLHIVSDEIYENFLYDGAKHFSPASVEEYKNRIITINGFSKKYSMTGWRIGYAVASEEIIKHMTLLNMYNAVCASSFAQLAATEALRHSQSFFRQILKSFESRRRLLCEGLQELGLDFVKPRGAFYVFPELNGIKMNSLSFCKGLLLNRRVSTVPGTSFGDSGEGHIRVSYSVQEKEMREGLSRMREYVLEVRK